MHAPSHSRNFIRPMFIRAIFFALLGFVLFIGQAVKPLHAEGELPTPIAKKLASTNVPSDALSIIVQELDSVTPLISLNSEIARNPASTMKLLTSFVALDVLGPNYRWKTRFYVDGKISDDVLDGNLYLRGTGDPYIITEDFWKLLGKLRQTGIRVINGDLIIDGSEFVIPNEDPGAFDGQPYRLYNVLPHATMVNFKASAFEFRPNRDGQRVDIIVDPPLPNLTIDNQLKVKQGRCRGYNRGIVMDVLDPTQGNQITFTGDFPSGCRSFLLRRSVVNHSAYTFGLFKNYWAQWGGEIRGGVTEQPVPDELRPMVVSLSRSLSDIVRPLNKWSNNVMTRLLLYALANHKYKAPVTKDQGVSVIVDYLQQKGIDTTDLIIDNGSGLSRRSRISASLMNEMLRHAYRSAVMPEFISSLSINGIDGTTRKRFKRGEEAGRMHLKTGRLDGVAAVAGYVLADSGKRYTVVMLGNYRNIHHGVGIELQNAVLKWVYQQ